MSFDINRFRRLFKNLEYSTNVQLVKLGLVLPVDELFKNISLHTGGELIKLDYEKHGIGDDFNMTEDKDVESSLVVADKMILIGAEEMTRICKDEKNAAKIADILKSPECMVCVEFVARIGIIVKLKLSLTFAEDYFDEANRQYTILMKIRDEDDDNVENGES